MDNDCRFIHKNRSDFVRLLPKGRKNPHFYCMNQTSMAEGGIQVPALVL